MADKNDKFNDNNDVSCIHSNVVNFKEDNNFDTIISMFNVVNHILNPENNPFTFTELVDMNEDGVINALDVVKLVNIIIGD